MHTSKLVNKPIELEASSIQLLRRLQFDNRLSSIPRLTSKGGSVIFIPYKFILETAQGSNLMVKAASLRLILRDYQLRSRL